MPASNVIVTDEWTIVKTTTKDTLIACGAFPVVICVGDTTGVTYEMGLPMDRGQNIIFPAGVSVYAMAAVGRRAPMWWTDFAS